MSFFGGGVGRAGVRVTGLNEIIASITAMVSESPSTRIRILREVSEVFRRDAVDNAHVITGKTKKSIRVESVTDKQAVISAGFGMPFEEKREGNKLGTPHKTFTQAAKFTAPKIPPIIKKHYDDLLRRHKTR